jgi:hypothetical protein
MDNANKGWLHRRIERGIQRGLANAYDTVRVDPANFLMQLRAAYGVPISTFHGVYSVPIEQLDAVGVDVIRAGMKLAAAEGAGFGLGGVFTILPDLGILAAITMRTIQKLSLVYGFEFNTDDEMAELWVAAASADIVEKWAGRLIPILSSAIGAGLNYYFVRAWGERALRHFRDKHLRLRHKMPQISAEENEQLLT